MGKEYVVILAFLIIGFAMRFGSSSDDDYYDGGSPTSCDFGDCD